MKYEDIKKVIQSCHLNFLIGSGASKPFLDTLQGIENALDSLNKREGLKKGQDDENVLKLIEVSIKYYYFKKCIKKNIELLANEDNSNNTLNTYRSFLDSLHTILAKRSSNIVSKQVNLFTTNMDIFLDVALEKCSYSYNDGFSGRMSPKFGTENFHNIINKVSSYYEYQSATPLFNLFKLHGSLNWRVNKENSEIHYDNLLESTLTLSEIELSEKEMVKCFDEKDGENKGNFLKLSDVYEEAKKKDLKSVKKKIDNFLTEYENLVMVNPNKEKFEETTLKLSYYELLRMYSNNLEKENSVLFVIGFSFADEHINLITQRVAKANPSLLIIIFAYNEGAEKAIRENLGENQFSNIIFLTGDEDGYTLDKVNQNFFERVVKELFAPPSKEKDPTANKEENGE